MIRKLPPLNALKAFEAAARHLSFSKAAHELKITQGAISKQVKLLEDYFDHQLFHRNGRRLKINKEAEEYFAAISLAFDSISNSSQILAKQKNQIEDQTLVVNAFASFGMYWLLPRINQFKKENPHINIYITSGYGSEVDAENADCDVIIWAYDHSFKNAEHLKILEEEMSLVCAKSLLKSNPRNLDELLNYPFLKNKYRPKIAENWARSINLKTNKIKTGLSFDYLYMLIEAAKQGLGMAFVPTILAQNLIKSGQLINPLKIKYRSGFSYYAVYPKKNRQNSEAIKKFSDWLIRELQRG